MPNYLISIMLNISGFMNKVIFYFYRRPRVNSVPILVKAINYCSIKSNSKQIYIPFKIYRLWN